MKRTVQDLEDYVYTVCAGLGDPSHIDWCAIAEELNGVQQTYFERFCCDTAVFQTPHTAAFTAEISESGDLAAPTFSDLLSVFLDDLLLPLMSPSEYHATKRPAATMENGRIVYRAEGGTYKQLTVIYRQRPVDIAYRDGVLEGGICLPLKHLPLMSNKIRECFLRANFDFKEADCYASAFNNWLTVLEGYADPSKEGGQIRMAL